MLLAMDDHDATCNTTIPVPTYHTWLQDWNKHMEGATSLVLVPSTAHQIHTPLVMCNWLEALWTYPLEELADFFLSGI